MSLKTTPLFECHQESGAHMVEFAHTLLPVRYDSEKEEHLAVRNGVGMFDVSHMGEFFVKGNAEDFLNYVLSNNVTRLSPHQAHYSLILNPEGGIIDDVIVYKFSAQCFMLCVNAANIDNDWNWLQQQRINFDVELENASCRFAQIALQGPKSIEILHPLCTETPPARFHFKEMTVATMPAIVAHTGYTGEDGVEIFMSNELARPLWKILLERGAKPCGLAARDSLRLEAGMLLHGVDIDQNTTPLEARLSFAVDFSKNFIGKEALLREKREGLRKILIGFRLLERGIARHGFNILGPDHTVIGKVSSGTWPPNHENSLGLGFSQRTSIKNGDEIFVDIRNRLTRAVVVKPRFLAPKEPLCPN